MYEVQQPAAKPKIWSKPPYLESVGKSEGGKRNPAPAVPQGPYLTSVGRETFCMGDVRQIFMSGPGQFC